MSTFVLIHGSGNGGWCWDKVAPLLTQAGHEVVAPDLPGHGDDKTPLREVSLQSCVDRVVEILDTQSGPVILVGHSTGGLTITQAAEQRPGMVRVLVYLTAFLLRNGERCVDMNDPESLARGNLVISKDEGNERGKEVFYSDCSDEDIAWAQSLLVPAPLQIAFTPVATTETNFGRVPRYYIECLRDRAITHACQRRMYMAMPCERVFTLGTSHSPFLSAPQALVDHLLAI
jgi:pimeloyl-ACP methyl ester carboxylesterase